MAVQESITGTGGGNDGEAIACTLDSAGFATQSGRWAQVLAAGALERAETVAGIRIQFRPESAVEQELRELIAVENECCSWASWTVESQGDQLVLRVNSTGDGVAVIRGMFNNSSPASTACCSDCA